MTFIENYLDINGIILFFSKGFYDDRGVFAEICNKEILNKIKIQIKQHNISISEKNVFRGMHLQTNPAMGKLIRCVSGEITDYFLDLRKNSETYGKYGSVTLKSPLASIWLPPGIAHGFISHKDDTIVEYLCSEDYNRETDKTFKLKKLNLYSSDKYIISEKDRNAPDFDGFYFEGS